MAEWTMDQPFVTSALYRMWPDSSPDRFAPESIRRTNLTRGRFSPRSSLKAPEKRKYLAHAGCETVLIHLSGPHPQHFTDLTVPSPF
jgi:hypothetical protein